ncbi:MAG: hypothetical protein WBG18_18800, partial [Xanthobacteraceae bacterium]
RFRAKRLTGGLRAVARRRSADSTPWPAAAATEFRKKESAPAAGQRARRTAAARDKESQNLSARVGGRAMRTSAFLLSLAV